MNIKQIRGSLLMLSVIFFSLLSTAGNPPPVGPSFYSSEVLNNILLQRDCDSVRFYNVIYPLKNGVMTTMAVGVRLDGSEISDDTYKYQVYSGVSVSEGVYVRIRKSIAIKACSAVKEAGLTSFSASFSKGDLVAMLTYSGANGIQLIQDKVNGYDTFKASPAELKEGSVTVLASASPAKVCGEPCPIFCGDNGNYVNR